MAGARPRRRRASRLARRGLALACLGLALPADALAPSHAADAPAPAPFTLERYLEGGAGLAGGPPVVAWRPGRDAWVEWRGEGRDRALVEIDAASGAPTTLLRPADLDALRGDDPPAPPLQGIGRAGPPSLVFARGGEVVVVPVAGDLVAVDLVRGTRARLTRTRAPIADVAPSPDGGAVAFARDGELWTARAGAEGPTETRLTHDGSDDVLNATLDWVYPEELDVKTAIQWSPDGKLVAFLRLDQRGVPHAVHVDGRSPHGAVVRQRFPRPGDPNPEPSVWVVEAEGEPPGRPDARPGARPPKALDLGPLPKGGGYVPWFRFAPDGRHVLVAVMPRDQKCVELVRCPVDGGPPTTWWRDEDPAWVDVPDPPHALADGAALVRSRRGGAFRLWRVPPDGAPPVALTPPDVEVGPLLAVDEASGAAFVTYERRDLLRTVVARVPLRPPLDEGGPRSLEAITQADASHTASFSTTGRVFLSEASRLDRPPVFTVRRAHDGTRLRDAGDAATPAWRALALPPPRVVRLPGDPELVASIRTPRALDAARRYPVLFHVYGGPGSRSVRDAFGGGHLFDAVLAEAGFVVVRVDGRGTSGRGKAFETQVHRRLGALEVEDLVSAVARLASEPWFDRDRVGVFGWSYGGYLAALAACRAPHTFRAAAAMAPVTDWRLYDSIYTERYMDGPDANAEGYATAAVTRWAKDARDGLLLVHGLADDNVHVAHTWRLVDALVQAKRPFDLAVLPGEGHGFASREARRDVHRRILEHFRRRL